MTVWTIEPRDPIIFRDGRPFGAWGGARAASLPFPFPSTIAGGVRTRAFLNAKGHFDPAAQGRSLDDVRALAVRGPFLVELDEADHIREWLFPAPLDAVAWATVRQDRFDIKRLTPLQLPPGVTVNQPADAPHPVGLATPVKGKPSGDAPRYWRWAALERWLTQAGDWSAVAADEVGHHGPVPEQRTHVGLDPTTLTADEGRLFQTRGLIFTGRTGDGERRRLALAVHVAGGEGIRPGPAPLGGERRLVHWRADKQALPACPKAVSEAVVNAGACRLVLATPGYFAAGWRPATETLAAGVTGLTVTLVGAAVGRAVVVSGWDFERNQAKPTRRLAPAGSVYFLRLEGSPEARRAWLDKIWLQPISDDEQARRDGFGCALVGAWDGQPTLMQEEQPDATHAKL
ncbi:MAG: type III-B CRISPR module-associated protein Cmr3 [Chloracidobacterium sp.]|nr:type III-B CRISPR module-associated protein Cmr3 [Chloracidobacterium sp.]MDW8217862.1 type III-B CRISPR module-associated protein Cmr3 [Acidobacteriota bacterium]